MISYTVFSAEKRPAEKTVYEWKRVFKQLKAFLKHDDAARVTAQDLVSWKNALVAANLRPKTIRDAKLAPVPSSSVLRAMAESG